MGVCFPSVKAKCLQRPAGLFLSVGHERLPRMSRGVGLWSRQETGVGRYGYGGRRMKIHERDSEPGSLTEVVLTLPSSSDLSICFSLASLIRAAKGFIPLQLESRH